MDVPDRDSVIHLTVECRRRDMKRNLEDLGDPELADMSRANDDAAFAELWRRHIRAGTTAARQFSAIADPQDIVSEAYLRILRALQQGGGPREAFRPYLYRTIHNIALDWRSRHPSVSLEDTADLIEPQQSIEIGVLENTITAMAFEELPERWRAVLWYLEVEGMAPSDAAPFLGLSPNATSALAVRAHEGFKKSWLQAHVNDRSVPAECRWTTERMGQFVRRSLTNRYRARFDRHLDDCDRCTLLLREIGELDGQLASVLLPVALGATAGSLLLGQLRDHAVGSLASTFVPTAASSTMATLASSAAAVVLVASGGLLLTAPAERPQPPTVTAEELQPSDPSPTAAAQPDPESSPPAPPTAPGEPEVAAVSAEATPDAAPSPPPAPVPASPATAPLVDLSVSVPDVIDLGVVVDIDPTGVIIEVLPDLRLLGG